MGNFTSCFGSNIQSARLIDGHGNLQHVKVPVTAAEIMLEQPGHLVSPVADDLRSSFKLSALRADQVLTSGKFYFLIPMGRLNSFVTESELAMLRAGCKSVNKVKRRRNSRVLPEEKSGVSADDQAGDGEGSVDVIRQRVCSSPMWKPVLEPIYE